MDASVELDCQDEERVGGGGGGCIDGCPPLRTSAQISRFNRVTSALSVPQLSPSVLAVLLRLHVEF